jgi:23S rRNA (cytosine1962-C5)-methyltransferase
MAGRSVRLLGVTGAAPDHPVGLDALDGSYLTAAWLLLGERRKPLGMDGGFDVEEGDEGE